MIIDLHCDTITALKGQSLYSNNLSVDILKLKKGNYLMQVFAIFTNIKKAIDPWNYCLDHIAIYHDECKKNSGLINSVKYTSDIKSNQLNSLLAIEETGVIGNDIAKLETLYALGVRVATLVWNHENSIGFPHTQNDRGLKPFGIEVVKKANELGIILDCSHLSEAGFWDLIRESKYPIIASHSNARALVDHSRNLTDEMIRAIDQNGGVIGVNYCGTFLNEEEASVAAIVSHIKHIIKVGSINCIALGSDFDGIDNPVEFTDAGNIDVLIKALEKNDFTKSDIAKITHENFIRIMRSCLK